MITTTFQEVTGNHWVGDIGQLLLSLGPFCLRYFVSGLTKSHKDQRDMISVVVHLAPNFQPMYESNTYALAFNFPGIFFLGERASQICLSSTYAIAEPLSDPV